MPARTHGERIERLEDLANNFTSRLDVQDERLKSIDEMLKKWVDTSEGHASKLTLIEKQLVVLVDFKPCLDAVQTIQKDLISIRKDVESLGKWKDDFKRERDEASRRRWAFGPNITAAVISGVIAILGIFLSYYLNKSK